MSAEFRGLRPDEHAAVLDLWAEVFDGDSRSYFEHYFTADPEYRDEDCRVAVVEGRLVSAVHICRRWMEWDDGLILCGAIANVATLEVFRRQGLSRELLRQAILRMEAERFAFSMLFTGSFGHYAAVGWEQVSVPRCRVDLAPADLAPTLALRSVPPEPLPPAVLRLYDAVPHRPLHLRRPPQYFPGWTGWFWRGARDASILLTDPEANESGYAVVALEEDTGVPEVLELQAISEDAEAELLRAAARWAVQRGDPRLELGFMPRFGGEQAVRSLGTVRVEPSPYMMLRRITLAEQEMARICAVYASGDAVFWHGDSF